MPSWSEAILTTNGEIVMTKHFGVLGIAMTALSLTCSVSQADRASSPSMTVPQWVVMAQNQLGPGINKQNPQNDPDVQRGIDERRDQELQKKIQACVDERTASLTPAGRAEVERDYRMDCIYGRDSTRVPIH